MLQRYCQGKTALPAETQVATRDLAMPKVDNVPGGAMKRTVAEQIPPLLVREPIYQQLNSHLRQQTPESEYPSHRILGRPRTKVPTPLRNSRKRTPSRDPVKNVLDKVPAILEARPKDKLVSRTPAPWQQQNSGDFWRGAMSKLGIVGA
jgi:hypothetical protein